MPTWLGFALAMAFVLLIWAPAFLGSVIAGACGDEDRSRRGQYFGCNVGIAASKLMILPFERRVPAWMYAERGILRVENGQTDRARADFRRAIDVASGGDLIAAVAEMGALAESPTGYLTRNQRALPELLVRMDRPDVPAAALELWKQELVTAADGETAPSP